MTGPHLDAENVVRPRRNRKSAKTAGTHTETTTARYLAARLGDGRIERRTKNGSKDRGDIAGVRTITGGRVVIEVKDRAQLQVKPWLDEAEVERGNDDAVAGVVVFKRTGVGHSRPGEFGVLMTLETLCVLLKGGVA